MNYVLGALVALTVMVGSTWFVCWMLKEDQKLIKGEEEARSALLQYLKWELLRTLLEAKEDGTSETPDVEARVADLRWLIEHYEMM